MACVMFLHMHLNLHHKTIMTCNQAMHRAATMTACEELRSSCTQTNKHSTARHSAAQHSTAQHSTAQHSTAQHSTAQHSTAQHSTAQHSMAERLASYSKQAYPRRGYLGGLPGTALERHLVYWHCLPHQPMCEHLILHPLHNNTQPCVHTQNAAH